MMYVIDASAGFEYLLRTPLGRRTAPILEQASLIAPDLFDAEILSILRRAVLAYGLSERRAREAIEDLRDWGVKRLSHAVLLDEAWSYRHNVTAYDAFYLAVAKLYGAPLLTADGPLARVPLPGFTVHNIRSHP